MIEEISKKRINKLDHLSDFISTGGAFASFHTGSMSSFFTFVQNFVQDFSWDDIIESRSELTEIEFLIKLILQ